MERHLPFLDLSTCVDAFGVLPPVAYALDEVNALRAYRDYPDPEALDARDHLGDVLGLPSSRIDVAPGAAELIWTLSRSLLSPGARALVWKPCFSEFEHAARAANAQVTSFFRGQGGILEDLSRLAEALVTVSPRVVYLCAPSCPLGEWVPAAELAALTARFPLVHFIVDQSYLNLSWHANELDVQFPPNVVLVRSLTKELGLPGVRVGYAVVEPGLRAQLQRQRPYWNLGSHALAVLQVYGECVPLLAKRRTFLLERARDLAEQLQEIGASPVLRDCHYFTVSQGPTRQDATSDGPTSLDGGQLTFRLANSGVAVRDCSSFGLPHLVRVVAHPEQAELVRAWSRVMGRPLRGGPSP